MVLTLRIIIVCNFITTVPVCTFDRCYAYTMQRVENESHILYCNYFSAIKCKLGFILYFVFNIFSSMYELH